ncbi:protein CLEC16A homolog isoform X3 [Homarus americanus]|uniref:protein CLEC16A homolog isoform X3 n=1 Tax=Homarus americanus TaxID=6706 RepID=UPI001C467E34|nr:protein CLEC16A homolog isoform X3 [Homarus americanus]
MLKGRGWFGGGLWKSKNPHSLEHLRYLYNVLSKNQVVQESNRGLLVENLRSIAEILIWGDQNDSSVFDFFLEKNMLAFFLRIMRQKCGSYVCVQLLQTLNILFENIRNETSLYYLLSNNHVNSIIVHKFDFSDEEVMAYYISFLKTLSLKLNVHTIHFFYNEHTNDFPLYTEAIKFFNHPESMVRIAVRTLTLNVYRVNDQSMLQFIRDRTAAPYFSNLVWFIGNHILELENCVRSDVDHNSRGRLADLVAEHLDHLHYLNDILKLDIKTLNAVLADHLLNRLLVPLLVYSLNPRPDKDDRPRISSVVSLFLLSQVFLIVSHAPLVRALAKIVFHADNSIFSEDSMILQMFQGQRLVRRGFVAPEEPLEKSLQARTSSGSGSSSSQSPGGSTSREEASSSKRGSEDDIRDSSGLLLDQEAEEAALCRELRISTPAADIMASIGISDLEATHVNITDEEKEQLRASDHSGGSTMDVGITERSLVSRPFLQSTVASLDCSDNDYSSLFALCLLYALGHNQDGINQELLDLVVVGGEAADTKSLYNTLLVDKMLEIISLSCQYNSRVRVATLEMAILVLKQLIGVGSSSRRKHTSCLRDHHLATLEGAREEATLMLRNFYKSEEIFLDMFEDEWHEMHRKPLNVEYLLQDASVLLPPAGTPLTGIDFNKRLPCGEVERARRAMRVFFLVREICLAVRDEPDGHLPLTNPAACVQVADVLDLNNSDLIACVVIPRDGQRTKRFLVIDIIQLILVEPDLKRLGWGVAKFVGFLQDLEVNGDKDDSRVLHLTIHRPSASSGATGRPTTPLLAAKFIFDDHIRCMAAKQRLTKGRIKARQRKLHQIARLLELPSHLQPCPSPPAHALHTMRQEAHRRGLSRAVAADGRSRSQSHRPMFNVTRVPGFALKREGGTNQQTISDAENASNCAGRSESQSPSRSGRQSNRQPQASHERGSRSSSRPRPRSEEIPMEDMMASGGVPQASPSLPKVNVESTSSPQGSNSSSCSSTAGEATAVERGISGNLESPARPNVISPGIDEGVWPCASLVENPELSPGPTRLLPPLSYVPPPLLLPAASDSHVFPVENDGNNLMTPPSHINPTPHMPASPPQMDEKETSFTAKLPLTRTGVGYDVFEPHTNGNVNIDSQIRDSPRNSVGSADFSPIRKGRVKGNVETV